jgi:ASC-1-like (ASCH) protein
MKKVIFAFTLLYAASIFAEYKYKPDANTLWIEDGKDIKVSPKTSAKGWLNKNLEVKELPDGKGFCMTSYDYKKYLGGRRLPVSKDYPYLVYEITGIKITKKYKSEAIFFPKSIGCRLVANMQKGIFVSEINCAKDHTQFLRIHLHGHTAEFKYMKAVKVPDQYITVQTPNKEIKPGDKIKFTVHLKEEAEDVTLRFYDSYCMPQLKINGMDKLQLKPEDEAGKIWSIEISLKRLGKKNKYKTGKILMKAVILGGNVTQPVWSPLAYGYIYKK